MTADFFVRLFDLDAVSVDDALLSTSERERVTRKATPLLRQRQAASFQCLRLTLAEVLGRAPAALEFRNRDTGKPDLVGGGVHFSVSHSGGVGLLAWGQHELGADVQALIARPTEALARKILTATEFDDWRSMAVLRQPDVLTRAWVRKEATLKAIGSGLRIPPRTVGVGVAPDSPAGSWAWHHDGRRWHGTDLPEGLPHGFHAAVCIEMADE